MPKKTRKRRSIAASRAASLKGWRTRKRMKEFREVEQKYNINMADILADYLKEMKPPTIDRVPKIEWK